MPEQNRTRNPSARIEVLGVGNALVDVISSSTDATLTELGMVKGSMDLIDEERMASVYAAMGQGTELSGGSAANTMAGLASFGIDSAFLGRVRDDFLGDVFEHDLEAIGVEWAGSVASEGPPTGACLILVTPDAERTMNTYLGASSLLGEHDVDPTVVGRAEIVYLEGYLFDRDEAKAAYAAASAAAHDAGRRVALTLSDSFCVVRHRADFADLVHSHVDILFSNHDEILALYETDDLAAALAEVRAHCPLAVVTLGESGAVIVTPDEEVRVPAERVDGVVDTTGAGDQFAAGFLAGLVRGLPLSECGRLGTVAAAEVISHLGPRPQVDLARLAGGPPAP